MAKFRNLVRIKSEKPKYYIQDLENELIKIGFAKEMVKMILNKEGLTIRDQVDESEVDRLVGKLVEIELKEEQRVRLASINSHSSATEWRKLSMQLESLEKFAIVLEKRTKSIIESKY